LSASDELLSIIEKGLEIELQNIKMIKKTEKELKSAPIKLMLYQIRMDSTKHAEILKNLLELLKGKSHQELYEFRLERYVGQTLSKRELQSHCDREHEMIERYQKALSLIDSPGLKMILEYLVDDEKRHHKMLTDLINKLHRLGP
jgi:rubrerythrin